MFDDIHQQNLADMLKAYLHRIPSPADRQFAMSTLKTFEGLPWHPALMQQAVDELHLAEVIQVVDRKFNYTGDRHSAGIDILNLLIQYHTSLTAQPEVQVWPEFFSTDQAADYIAAETARIGKPLSARGVKHYIDEEKKLVAPLVGGKRVFVKPQLDTFVHWYVGAGIRPGPATGSRQPRRERI